MSTEVTQVSQSDVERTLGGDSGGGGPAQPPFWRKHLKWLVLGVIVLLALYFFFGRSTAGKVTYTTQEITRGPITVTVTATGNLEPRNQVDIGSELSGTMRIVNVDVNDVVKANQVLAELDTTRLNAQVLQAQSSLASADARVIQADAATKEAR